MKSSSTHLLDHLLSHCAYEGVLSGIRRAGKHEVLPDLDTHITRESQCSGAIVSSPVLKESQRSGQTAFVAIT